MTARDDHIIPTAPTLSQPSQINDFGISNILTEGTSDGKKEMLKTSSTNQDRWGQQKKLVVRKTRAQRKITMPSEKRETATDEPLSKYGCRMGCSNAPAQKYRPRRLTPKRELKERQWDGGQQKRRPIRRHVQTRNPGLSSWDKRKGNLKKGSHGHHKTPLTNQPKVQSSVQSIHKGSQGMTQEASQGLRMGGGGGIGYRGGVYN